MDINYGKHNTTNVIDENGSTKTRNRTYRAGVNTMPTSDYYEVRYPTGKYDIQRLSELMDDAINDPLKLDVTIRLEGLAHNKDSYHVVVCYSMLSLE